MQEPVDSMNAMTDINSTKQDVSSLTVGHHSNLVLASSSGPERTQSMFARWMNELSMVELA